MMAVCTEAQKYCRKTVQNRMPDETMYQSYPAWLLDIIFVYIH